MNRATIEHAIEGLDQHLNALAECKKETAMLVASSDPISAQTRAEMHTAMVELSTSVTIMLNLLREGLASTAN